MIILIHKLSMSGGLQLAARRPNLARIGQTIGPQSSAKMLRKFITFSLKSIFWY